MSQLDSRDLVNALRISVDNVRSVRSTLKVFRLSCSERLEADQDEVDGIDSMIRALFEAEQMMSHQLCKAAATARRPATKAAGARAAALRLATGL